MDFTGSKAEGDDLLGDAYEYLMRHFATQSGKSKGQFYTPAEVSRVMAQLLQIPADTPKSTTVYDPTCGSGSLLIKVADAAPNGLTIYGQENDNATWALARMNMILHGNETARHPPGQHAGRPEVPQRRQARRPSTTSSPIRRSRSRPGRTASTTTTAVSTASARPPDKNGDYAFLLHMVKSLKSHGQGRRRSCRTACCSAATPRRRSASELIKRGYIKAIIGLPANLFYGTGIPACLIVLDKEDAQARTGIFMIDASQGLREGRPQEPPAPARHAQDRRRLHQAEGDRRATRAWCRSARSRDPKNDYNLNIPRYIDSSEPEDIQDLHAHLQGGIPNRDLDALQPYWDAFPSLRGELFKPLRDGYSELDGRARPTSRQRSPARPSTRPSPAARRTPSPHWWAEQARACSRRSTERPRPNDLIHDVSEALLEDFRPRPLIDEYGVYEQLMSYWNDLDARRRGADRQRGLERGRASRAPLARGRTRTTSPSTRTPTSSSVPAQTRSAGSWT